MSVLLPPAPAERAGPHTMSPGKQISSKEGSQPGTHAGLGTGPALRMTSFA